MIVPSKALSLDDSALARCTAILQLGSKSIELSRLYTETAPHFATPDQFLIALDILFVLGRISINMKTRMVEYAA